MPWRVGSSDISRGQGYKGPARQGESKILATQENPTVCSFSKKFLFLLLDVGGSKVFIEFVAPLLLFDVSRLGARRHVGS